MARTARPDPLAFLGDELAALRERNLYRPLRVMSSAQGPIASVDGQRVISLSSNDYLGLTHHPRLREAALAAVRDFGVGSGAVRTIAGTMSMHEELEAELAAFKSSEAVLTFQSGFSANTGVAPTITGETDLIVSDELNHASIIDGMRLSKAPRKIYPHADVEALGAVLHEAVRDGRGVGHAGDPADAGAAVASVIGRLARSSPARGKTLSSVSWSDEAPREAHATRSRNGSINGVSKWRIETPFHCGATFRHLPL